MHRPIRALTATLALLAGLTLVGPAVAQLSVAAATPLDFGMLTPGVSVTIPHTDPRAATADIDGLRANQTIVIRIDTPTVLTNALGAQLPVSFAGLNAQACRNGRNGACRETLWDPTTGWSPSIKMNGNLANNLLDVALGGTANPQVGQAAGVYSGIATITVAIIR